MTAEQRQQEVRDGVRRYSRISLELSHSWPGEMYLRFETGPGMAVMVGVTPADLADLKQAHWLAGGLAHDP
jgi:hypothetical protein